MTCKRNCSHLKSPIIIELLKRQKKKNKQITKPKTPIAKLSSSHHPLCRRHAISQTKSAKNNFVNFLKIAFQTKSRFSKFIELSLLHFHLAAKNFDFNIKRPMQESMKMEAFNWEIAQWCCAVSAVKLLLVFKGKRHVNIEM